MMAYRKEHILTLYNLLRTYLIIKIWHKLKVDVDATASLYNHVLSFWSQESKVSVVYQTLFLTHTQKKK